MTASERKSPVLRSCLCFNCLDNHKICNCDKDNNCRRCRDSSSPKHFYLLHQAYVLYPEGSRDSRNFQSVSKDASCKGAIQVCGVKVELSKAALSRVAKIINPRDGVSR